MAEPGPLLLGRLGGPVGSRARREGVWFNPLPWTFVVATLVWLLTLLRHVPCQQERDGQSVDAFLRLCYSDIPLLWQDGPLGTGGYPFRDTALDQSPLVQGLVALCAGLTRLLGAEPVPGQPVVDGAHLFFLTSAVLLFCCFLVTVACASLLGRSSATSMVSTVRGRRRSWDAMYVAAAPGVFAGALVSWDMFGVALVAAALLAWALRRTALAGVLLGLACSTGFWPLLVLLAIGLATARTEHMAEWGRSVAAALLTWAAVNLPLMLLYPSAWVEPLSIWHDRGPDLGSSWFVLEAVGVRIPAFSGLVLLAMLGWTAFVCSVAMRAPRRPRIAQLAFLLVAGWLLLGKGFAPQQVLALVLLVPLARPNLADWAIWSVAELLYTWAVWAHLGGDSSPGSGGPDVLYWGAIGLHVVVLGWLVAQVVHDVRRPWQDPVRASMVDDPLGGVLDHCPDRPPRVGGPRPSPCEDDATPRYPEHREGA